MGTSKLWPALPSADSISADQITNLRNITLRGNLRSLNWDGGSELERGSAPDGLDPNATRGFLFDASTGAAHIAGGFAVGRLAGGTPGVLYFDPGGGIWLFSSEDESLGTDGMGSSILTSTDGVDNEHTLSLHIQGPIFTTDSKYGPALVLSRPDASGDPAFNLNVATSGAGPDNESWPQFVNIVSPDLGGTCVAVRVRQFSAGAIQQWLNAAGSEVASVHSDVGHNLQGLAWTTWTPSHTNLTVGNGTQVARYVRMGDLVIARWSLVFGSTTSISGTPVTTLPFDVANVATNERNDGTGSAHDDSTNARHPLFPRLTTDSVAVMYLNSSVVAANMSATLPFTWTTDDVLSWQVMYEAA